MTEKKAAKKPETPPAKKQCFVISPIGQPGSKVRKHADTVLEYIIKPALEGDPLDFEVFRADEGSDADMITASMIQDLNDCDLCVAVLTGHNPNVFYEVGIRHAYQKPLIQMIAEGEQVPFDNREIRTITYDVCDPQSHKHVRKKLAEVAGPMKDPKYRVVNPVTMATGLAAAHASGDEKDRVIANLAEFVSLLEANPSVRLPIVPFKLPQILETLPLSPPFKSWDPADQTRLMNEITRENPSTEIDVASRAIRFARTLTG